MKRKIKFESTVYMSKVLEVKQIKIMLINMYLGVDK